MYSRSQRKRTTVSNRENSKEELQTSQKKTRSQASTSRAANRTPQFEDEDDTPRRSQRRQRNKSSEQNLENELSQNTFRKGKGKTSQKGRQSQTVDDHQQDLEDYLNCSNVEVNLDEQAADVVRYFLFTSKQNMCIRKAELQKNVVPKIGRMFNEIMQQADKILQEVFGLKLCCLDSGEGTGKFYVLNNLLTGLQSDESIARKKILLLLILTHIFMSDPFPVLEESIYAFLESLEIDVHNKCNETYGDIKDYVQNVLIKQKYLNKVIDDKTKQTVYSWGPRAEKTISKMEILNFVNEFYKLPAKSWAHHYKLSQNQKINEKLKD